MTPQQIEQKLAQMRAKKLQIDQQIGNLAKQIEDQTAPLKGYQSSLNKYWKMWREFNFKFIMKKKDGEKKARIAMALAFLTWKELAEAYVDAFEAAPEAVKNADKLIGELLAANNGLQKARDQVLALQIPQTATPSQLASIQSQTTAAKNAANQSMDQARAVLTSLPGKRSKIKPLIDAVLKMVNIVIKRSKEREQRLKDKLVAIKREDRIEVQNKLQKILDGYRDAAVQILKSADKFVEDAPSNANKVKDQQDKLNSELGSIAAALTVNAGSSNTISKSKHDILSILAIGGVAVSIALFDTMERRFDTMERS